MRKMSPHRPSGKLPRMKILVVACFLLVLLLVFLSSPLLSAMGRFLIKTDQLTEADAVIVLNTGVDYYPRLIEAALLFNRGYANRIVINGNRKTDILRELEAAGFEACCQWCENHLRILALYGIPRDAVICLSAEDAYDTISEAAALKPAIERLGFAKVIVVTSRFHTRRARFIWRHLFGDELVILSAGARQDPYDENGWWQSGRQIRWVLQEYGAWAYWAWKNLVDTDSPLPVSAQRHGQNGQNRHSGADGRRS
jgi:uncharacterized SAM-binding protein YcdF (DUF218 family)